LLLFDLKIYENSCKTHIRVLSYFVRIILSGNLYTVLKLVEQELPTLPEHLSSPAVFSGVRILFVMFVDRCLSLYPFSFGHCVVCPSSIYIFWWRYDGRSYIKTWCCRCCFVDGDTIVDLTLKLDVVDVVFLMEIRS
jgi:hypothetical protein